MTPADTLTDRPAPDRRALAPDTCLRCGQSKIDHLELTIDRPDPAGWHQEPRWICPTAVYQPVRKECQ